MKSNYIYCHIPVCVTDKSRYAYYPTMEQGLRYSAVKERATRYVGELPVPSERTRMQEPHGCECLSLRTLKTIAENPVNFNYNSVKFCYKIVK